jgi:hypothetical protein
MTETEWAACQSPENMLEYLRGRVSDRKLLLIAVARCRSRREGLPDLRGRAVEIAELYGDGLTDDEELKRACEESFGEDDDTVFWVSDNTAETKADHSRAWKSYEAERAEQCQLLQCIAGNVFRPVSLAPAVLAMQGGVVVRMATAIYNDRRWEDMPLLGDALEEAGCDDQTVLDHCRGSGPHARGCFVVDAILKRS